MPVFNGTGFNGGSAVPFQRVMNPAQLSSFLNLEQAELNRIQRIAESTRFYLGQQWGFQREGGDPLVTINMIRKLVDKSVEFLVAEGFTVNVPSPLVEITVPFLTEVSKQNKQQQFAWKAATVGGITGDVFVLVTYQEPTAAERQIYPHSKGKIRIQLLLSEQVFPTWDPMDPDRLLSVRIETVYYADKGINDLTGDMNHQGRNLYTQRFTQIITPTEIVEQLHGGQPVRRRNILGEIPVVHWQNIPFPGEFYGLPDTQDLIDLQREFNEKSTDISDIINYQGSPVTVITGGKAKNLERGPKQIWSGLPADAKVYNLGLEGNLAEAELYRKSILEMMYALSDVPEGSLGKIQPISNTSGAALHTQFEPLIKKTHKKRATYEPGIEKINYLILRIAQTTGMLKLPFDVCRHCGGKVVETEDPKNTEIRWVSDIEHPEGGTFQEFPVRKKKCYEMDPQTQQFRDPMEMRLNFVHEYGFGNEVKDTPLWAILRRVQTGQPSFWDYAAQDLLNQKAHEAQVNQVGQMNQALGAQAATTPPPVDELGNPTTPPGGMAIPPPPVPVRLVQPLPPGFVDVPEEPEQVVTIEQYTNPITGMLVGERKVPRFLVPTGCRTPEYLNPFETEVQFHDTLPKDEALRAQLMGQYLTMGVVDAQWVQDRIPEISEDVDTLRRRMKASKEAAQNAVMGQMQSFQEAAPPPQKAEGDPTASGPNSPDSSAQKAQQTALVGSQKEVSDG